MAGGWPKGCIHEGGSMESAGREKVLDFRNAREAWRVGG